MVEATKTAVVAFEVPPGVRVDTRQWTLSGNGAYKVALLDRTVQDRAAAGWNLLLADITSFGEHSRIALGAVGEEHQTAVPPGRYRLHLVSDAPITLRIPVQGFAGRLLRATTPARVQVQLTKDAPSSGLVPPHSAHNRIDFELGNDLVFQAARWRFSGLPGPQRFEVDACVAPRRLDCTGDGAGSTGLRTSQSESSVTVSRIQDTFDHQFRGRASAVTHFGGTDQPHRVTQLLVAVPVAGR